MYAFTIQNLPKFYKQNNNTDILYNLINTLSQNLSVLKNNNLHKLYTKSQQHSLVLAVPSWCQTDISMLCLFFCAFSFSIFRSCIINLTVHICVVYNYDCYQTCFPNDKGLPVTLVCWQVKWVDPTPIVFNCIVPSLLEDLHFDRRFQSHLPRSNAKKSSVRRRTTFGNTLGDWNQKVVKICNRGELHKTTN